ncbi:MAG: hypothetical protein KAR40_05750 [Candidatus Sabulitectum sp.]|nr:hypothetical protein [Candidatus Sabulitectum sp.]
MTEEKKKVHHQFAVDCFNSTWDLLDKKDRTQSENMKMIHTAHASRFHWGEIGTPLQFQRGEWQISRVYAVLGLGESALFHAKNCHDICTENSIGDFDMAFACEAVARAHHVLGNSGKRDIFIRMATVASESIKNPGDKEYFLGELNSVN